MTDQQLLERITVNPIQRLLAGYSEQLIDSFVVVTETRVRFARTVQED